MSNIVEVNHRSKAITNLAVGASWSLIGETLTWGAGNTQTQPTEAEIDAEVIRLQAEYDANQYQRDRKAKYDALNQLELISDDAINGTTTHKDAILAIKAEFPKETI